MTARKTVGFFIALVLIILVAVVKYVTREEVEEY